MSKVFFYSDPHFSHTNMAAARGFSSIEEHDNQEGGTYGVDYK